MLQNRETLVWSHTFCINQTFRVSATNGGFNTLLLLLGGVNSTILDTQILYLKSVSQIDWNENVEHGIS